MTWVVVGLVAFLAATLAAVTGFGGAAVLLPVLVVTFGVRDAVPILTVAQLVGNGSRVWFNGRHLDGRVVVWFALAPCRSASSAGSSSAGRRSAGSHGSSASSSWWWSPGGGCARRGSRAPRSALSLRSGR
jgi:hypothetical protein